MIDLHNIQCPLDSEGARCRPVRLPLYQSLFPAPRNGSAGRSGYVGLSASPCDLLRQIHDPGELAEAQALFDYFGNETLLIG